MVARKFFLLFLTVESAFCTPAGPSKAKTPGDFFELMKTSERDFNEFYRTLESQFTHQRTEINALYWLTGPVKFSEVAQNLNGMIGMFMDNGNRYLARHLVEFCDLITQLIDVAYPERGVREELRFPDDCVYCAVLALRDTRRGYEKLFEYFYLFRTIDPADTDPCPLEQLRLILYKYRRGYDYVYPQRAFTAVRSSPGTDDHSSVVDRLRQVKEEITNFSKMFCRWWTPIVSNDFLSTPVADQVQNESRFVRHVHFNEKCTILIGTVKDQGEPTNEWWWEYPYNANKVLFSWSCDNILVSQEYGFEEYQKSLNPKKEVVESTDPEPKQKVKHFLLSLAELKDGLKSNKYYMVALRYYNVVSEAMVVASIKEGNKMMRGITLVVRWSCTVEGHDQRVETIRGLRTKLSAFKSAWDELFWVLTQYKRPENATQFNGHKNNFDLRVASFMRFLDDGRQYCGDETLPETLTDTNADVYPADDPVGVLKFTGYYFDQPILHVGELYRFNARDANPHSIGVTESNRRVFLLPPNALFGGIKTESFFYR